MIKRRCEKTWISQIVLKPTKYQHLDVPKSLLKTSLFFISSKKKSRTKINKKHRKHLPCKNITKTNEISTFATPGLDPRTTPNDQNRHKGPPGHPPDAPREPFVFSVPFGPSPRTPWDPLRTPQGPPGTPKATPRDHQGPSRTPKRRPRTPKGSPRTSQDPLRDPKEAQRSPVNL